LKSDDNQEEKTNREGHARVAGVILKASCSQTERLFTKQKRTFRSFSVSREAEVTRFMNHFSIKIDCFG
jgi:hypothetical protein